MKVLVTGGGGFIGSHLVDLLLSRGDEVVVLDDLSVGKAVNLASAQASPHFRFVTGSVLDPDAVRESMSGCKMVYHLAAAVGVKYIVDDPLQGIMINVRGTENVLAEAHRLGCKVLLASTSEIYGKSQKIPFSEDDDRILGSTRVARWSYSTAKALDEHLTLAYGSRGLPVVIVRYFNSYGPRLDPRGYGSVVAKFVTQALRGESLTIHGDGQQTRCFCFVSDTVRGTLLAGTDSKGDGEVFNIGRGHESTVEELANTVLSLTGSSSRLEFIPYAKAYGGGFEDVPRRVPSVEKAEAVLGFKAAVPLTEGLKDTIAWLRKEGSVAD